jgi:hypothetical protein
LLDVSERHVPGVDVEAAGGDRLGYGGKFGEVLPRADRALAAADGLQPGGAQGGRRDRRGRAVCSAIAPIVVSGRA